MKKLNIVLIILVVVCVVGAFVVARTPSIKLPEIPDEIHFQPPVELKVEYKFRSPVRFGEPETPTPESLPHTSSAPKQGQESIPEVPTPTVVPTPTPAPTPEPPPANSTTFDSNKALEHVRILSMDIGPRVAGTPEERRACEYVRWVLESELGYETIIQDVPLGGSQTSCNVIAGSKNGILLGAHLDSAGVEYLVLENMKPDDLWVPSPGANDNASGVGVVLELARVLKGQSGYIFVLFGAEEFGLDGSTYFVSNNDYDVEAVIILDMVGRSGDCCTCDYCQNTSSTVIQSLSNASGCSDPHWGASDHVSFLHEGIPAGQLYVGCDPDDYHTPRDTFDKIDPSALQKTGEIVLEALGFGSTSLTTSLQDFLQHEG